MTRRTWLFLAAALFAISALATYGTVANASLPTTSGTLGAQSVSVAAAAPQQQSKDQPFNCAQIDALGINKQMNLHAAEIMTQCGRGKEVLPQQAVKGSGGDFSPTVYGGPDVNVHPPTSPSIQSESFSWRHGSTIVVAYNDLGTCTGNVSTSTDGGATFAVTGNGVFCTGHGTNFGDPAVSFDPVRNKWIAEFLASGCGGQGVGAWNSTDGITWATAGCAANVGSGSGDRNSAWTDNNPSSPFYGRSYISYNDFSIGGGALRTAFSTDGGTTWSTPVTVVGSFQRDIQMSGDLTGSNGYAYLAGMDEGGGGAANRTNYMHRSTDGGLTWNQIQQNPPYAPPGAAVCSGNSYFYTITPQIRHMGWGQPVVGAAGVVHYVFAQHGTGADEGNIMYTRSTDFGATWSTPIQLNTDAGLRAQWMPSVGATSGGGVFVKWYDRRNTANNDYEIYGRQSNDNGLTWQLDAAVSDAVIPMPIVQTANCYDGDYDYWQGDGTNIQGSWTDSRGSGSGGTQDVFHDGVTGAGGTATPTSTGTPPTATRTFTPSNTPTATPTACGGAAPYTIATATGTIIPGVTDTGSHCDDCLTAISLPFPFTLYDQTFTTASVDSNGTLQFVPSVSTFTNTCLPGTGYTYTIFPYWDDLYSVTSPNGTYTTITGTAPNRIFSIEWRTQYFPGSGTADFEVQLYEGQNRFDVIYGTLTNDTTSATIGVQKDSTNFTQYICNTAGGAPSGRQLIFTRPSCATGTPATATNTPILPTATRTNTVGAATATATTCTPGGRTPGPWATGTPYPITDVRYGFAQVGNSFYVIGGVSGGTRVATVYRYDTGPGTWTLLANIPVASEDPTCAYNSSNNSIYCAEGDTGSGFFRYDIATNVWTTLTNVPGPANRYGAASGAFNGKVFVVGGNAAASTDVEVYDVTAGTWSAGTAVPTGFFIAGYQPVGQYLYVVGGFTAGGPVSPGSSKPIVIGNAASVLDASQKSAAAPSANNAASYRLDMTSAPGVWSTGPAFTPARADFGLAYDPGTTSLYAIGGDATGGGYFDSTNLVDSLNVSAWPAGTWTSSPPVLPAPNRQANQAGFYGAGDIWSVGGIDGATFTFLADVERRSNGGGGGCATPTTGVATATATPTTCTGGGGGGTPVPWATASPMAVDAYGMFTASDGTYFYAGGGYSFSGSGQITQFERYNPATGSWTPLAAVPDITNGLAAAEYVPSQNKIYVFGGDDATTGTVVNFTRIYDVATNTWSSGAAMPDVRAFMAHGYFNGKIYLVGGYSTGNVSPAFAQVWEYDPVANTFNTTRLDMPHALGGAASGVVNGHLIVAGGRDAANLTLNSTYDYDIVANTWATDNNLPVVNNVPAGAVIAGNLWVMGGGNPFSFNGPSTRPNLTKRSPSESADAPSTTNSLYIFNQATNTWSTGPSLIQPRSFPAGGTIGNKVLVVGGYTGSTTTASLEVNNTTGGGGGGCATPTVGVPTATATVCVPGGGGVPGPWATSTPGPAIRYRSGGTTDGTNVYIYGGSNAAAAYLNDLWRWSPATQTWTQLANMPTGKSNIQGAYWNGKIYVPGGYIGSHITENAIYDIASNTWTTGAPLPAAQSGENVAFNNKVYVFGGNPGPQATTSIYDIASNTWTTGAVMPQAVTYGRATLIGNFAYYLGGIPLSGTAANTFYRYDLVAGTWTTLASAQIGLTGEELMASPDGTKIFSVMGGTGTSYFVGVPLAQTVEIYDVATDTWTYGNPVVTTASSPGGSLAGGKLMVQGGVDNTSYYDLVQVSVLSGGGGGNCATPTTGPSPTNTAVVTATPTVCTTNYTFATATGTIIPGTVDTGNHQDDGVVTISLPFPYTFYGQSFSTADVDSNGMIHFVTGQSSTFTNTCLPAATYTYTMFPYWDDLYLVNSGFGIFTSVTGTAPNRIFNIEWRAQYFPGSGTANFEVQLYEGQNRFDVIYGTLSNDTSSATIGTQKDTTTFAQYICNTAGGAPSGLRLIVSAGSCGSPVPTNTTGVASPTPPATVVATATCVAQAAGWTTGAAFNDIGIVRGVGVWFPGNGRFYVMGGRTSDAVGSDTTNPHEYNPATDTWTTKAAVYPDTNVNNMACGVLTIGGGSKIVCVGGSTAGGTTASARVFTYDPVADAIATLGSDNWTGNASGDILPGGFAVVSNKLYVVGGFQINLGMTDGTYSFDPALAAGSRWTTLATYPMQRGYIPTAAIGNALYTGGGSLWDGTTLQDTTDSYKYDIAANMWTAIAPITRVTAETRALTINGTMWVLGGGRVAPNPSNEVDIYDPASNSWSLGTPFVNPRRNFPADTDGAGNIYLVGGYEPSTAATDMEIYHPAGACGTPVPTSTSGVPTATATVCVPSIPVVPHTVGLGNPGTKSVVHNGKGATQLKAGVATTSGKPAAWKPTAPITFQVDDGSIENAVGWANSTTNFPAIWINRYSPLTTDFPIRLNQISILFPGPAQAGRDITGNAISLLVYVDANADNDPSDAVNVAQIPATVTVANGTTFSNYAVNVLVNTPGDIYIGFADTYNSGGVGPVSHPAALDTTSSQVRSWVAAMSTNADPDYTTIGNNDTIGTIDSFGLPGNWMIRASGDTQAGGGCPTVVPTSTSTVAPSATNTVIVPTSTSTTIPPTSTSTATDTPVPPTACPIQFADVLPGSDFYPYVRCLACRKVANGYPCGGPGEPCNANNDGYFRPFANITRGQIAKMVSIAAGFGEDPGPQIYTDVPTTQTFYPYINRLTNRGFMGGYNCGGPFEPCDAQNRPYFRPGANATRGQVSKIVANAAGIQTPIPAGQQTYEDVPSSNPFWVYIERLTDLGVMSGYNCGGPGEPCVPPGDRPYFRPFAQITRGQTAKIVANTFFPNCQTPVRTPQGANR